MKIVVLDGYVLNPGDLSWAEIERFGELRVYDRTAVAEVCARIRDADVVYTNKTPLTGADMERAERLKLIVMLSTGYDVVDVAAAARRGIPVCNVPVYGTDAVAQMALALLLEICMQAGRHNAAVHAGRWIGSVDYSFRDTPLIELAGKTMGIVGCGAIGRRTAELAAAFGMRVLGYNPRPKADFPGELVPLDALLAASDVVSLHCPANEASVGMIDRDSIAKMKDGAILINTARGKLIVEADLAEALSSGKLYAAGLDVVYAEPMRADNPLLGIANCIITPHIGWAPLEARARLMAVAAENLAAFIAGKPINCVNMEWGI